MNDVLEKEKPMDYKSIDIVIKNLCRMGVKNKHGRVSWNRTSIYKAARDPNYNKKLYDFLFPIRKFKEHQDTKFEEFIEEQILEDFDV